MTQPTSDWLQIIRNRMLMIWLIAAGALLSLLLVAFAVHNYRTATPVAAESLRGLGLSLTSAIESLASRDPSLAILRRLHSRDVAYFTILDRDGTRLFHTNPDLIGSEVDDKRFLQVFADDGFLENRIFLGTGEEVYELTTPLHLDGKVLALRLALHAYRADAMVRRAKMGIVVVISLLVAGWVMGIFLYRAARRASLHRQEMANRERLAQLGTMGAILAHEVRNPLSGIKGYAQLLGEQLEGEEEKTFTNLIVTEAQRLEGLVNDLLAYARQEPLILEPVALPELLTHCVGLLERTAALQGVAIEYGNSSDLTVNGDRDRLEQILLNLLQNALQAMPEGGRLSVHARRRGRNAEIVISDTGHGISQDELKRIFEPFFTTRARGSGLGLAICRKFAEEMGGTIYVESIQGEGSTFRVVLPSAS